ncbi:MAG: cobalamin biosynthesis protein CobQ [Pseudomonadota bacterium]
MNTPAHVIFAATAFARPHDRRRTLAAVAGALAPDLSLYVMACVSLYILQIPAQVVFDELYFSPAWQQVFAIDNSFFVWGGVLALAWWLNARNGMVFAASALMHIALDFPLHHDDGRAHFWPVSTWVFESPISYWDRSAHASIIGPIEMALCALFTWILLRRYTSVRSRAVICALALVQLAPVFIWVFVFSSG